MANYLASVCGENPYHYNLPHQYLQELFEYLYDGLLVVVDSPASLLRVILTLCDLKEYLLQSLNVRRFLHLSNAGGRQLVLSKREEERERERERERKGGRER